MSTPVVRVVPSAPLEAEVQVERGSAWRALLVTRGPDALARAHDLRRLLEAGILVVAAHAARPAEVPAAEHPDAWMTMNDAIRALGERRAQVLARIDRGELRARATDQGIVVRAEDVAALAPDQPPR